MSSARAAPVEIHLADYRAPDFYIDRVDLVFDLVPQETRVRSTLQVRRQGAHDRPLVLDGEGLTLLSVAVDGRPLAAEEFVRDEVSLRLPIPGDTAVVQIENTLNPAANTALEGLYVSSGNFCTQCEPEGFRRITYFIDRPDVLARYTVTLIADAEPYPVLLANGNPVSAEALPGGRHMARWVDPHPKPSYLFALVAGKLHAVRDEFVTQSGKRVDLAIYVEAHNLDRCAHAMDSLKRAMRWDEEVYGREYDLDVFNIVAVDDFNMGAMENKGLNIFNSRYILARPDTATDADYAGIESVVAHEYFHNWSGNRVTCRDWFQLSLKEGFTVFRDQEFSADMGSRAVKRIADVNVLRQFQFAEDAGPQKHPVQPKSYREINNFYTSTVYNKGAEVVRMQRNLLGAEKFRAGTDLYFSRFDGQAVTIEDFFGCMSEVSGLDLQPFRRWYDVAGTPVLTVSDAVDGGRYQLTLRQSLPGQAGIEPFMLPFTVALFDANGHPVPLDGQAEHTLVLRELEQTVSWAIPDAKRPLVPSLNRGFTAPVQVDYPYTPEQLAVLSRADTDDFNRWDAFLRLMQHVLLARIRAAAEQGKPGTDTLPEDLSTAFGALLHHANDDPMFVAECITLPTESYLADQFSHDTPVVWIHQERRRLRAELAAAWASTLHLLYRNHEPQGAYHFDGRSAGQRALRRQVLSYLCALDEPAWWQLAAQQFATANNMTESFNALLALSVTGGSLFEEKMQAFEARWRQDPLVMDKWFALQAQRTDGSALARVQSLMAHPAFSFKNPNRVRALLGSFSRGNLLHFHAADGESYRWFADRIIELDAMNPQIAARMASVFNTWRRFDGGRAAAMRAVLEKLHDRPDCSPDLAEITGKALG
ncbi:aminopeptidase N [Halothiobacillus sp. DCM-1]|uniref:aminopeptidase N n=1 Tax=Halothiobacillus sp. DCM-1 TaxID=3112558 RepID=UPI003252F92A